MNPLSFLTGIPMKVWEYLAVAAVILALVLFIYNKGGEGPRAELAAFQEQVRVQGEAAVKAAEAQKKADQLKKEKTDEDHAKTVIDFKRTIASLRERSAPSSFVPAAPAGASRPDLVCFDRAEYIRADGDFTTEARGLADEGTTATIDLDSAKKWAQ